MRLIVVSLDAVGASDVEYLEKNPYFKEFMESSSYCRNVKSVYPSVTYPAHTSIVTGCLPKRHGVVNNTLVQPERIGSPDWMWQRKYVKTTTLYDEALSQGKTVASLLWPVTAKSKITYNLPEVLPNRPWQNQITASLTNGSPLFQAELLKKFGKQLSGIKQPQLDDFTFDSALYTLRKYKPDLMLIHLTDVDTNRHESGLNNALIYNALDRHIERLKKLDETLVELGILDETYVAVLGDHYQKQTHTVIYPNYYLLKEGYISLNRRGKIKNYRAICHDADGSAYIYVKDKADEPKVKRLFKDLKNTPGSGIKEVYSQKEATFYGADPACSLMLECEEGFYIQDGYNVPLEPVEKYGKGMMLATHGYHPEDDGYKTFFMVRGKNIMKNHEIASLRLIDEGPLFAKLIGVNLGAVDGRCPDEIFC